MSLSIKVLVQMAVLEHTPTPHSKDYSVDQPLHHRRGEDSQQTQASARVAT